MATEWEVVSEKPASQWDVVSENSSSWDPTSRVSGAITPRAVWNFIKEGMKPKNIVENLPAIGMTGGAMAGALPGVATGPFAPAVIAGAAGAGGLGGEALKQILGPYVGLPGPTSPEQASAERAEAGKVGMMAEMGGQGLSTVLAKLLVPFASRMTPEAQKIRQIAKENNLPISPEVTNPSLPARAIQGTIDKTPIVNMWTNRYRGQLQENLTGIAQTARGKYSNEAISEMEKMTDEAYATWLKSVETPTIKMESTINALKSIDRENLTKNAKKTLDVILYSVKEGNELPLAAIQKIKLQMGTVGKGNLDIRKMITDSMKEDIGKVAGGEEAVKILGETDQLYRLQKVGRDINNLFKASMRSDGVSEKFLPLEFIKKYTPEFQRKIKRDAGDVIPQLDQLLEISKASLADLKKLKGFNADKYIPTFNVGAMGAATVGSFYDPERAPYYLAGAGVLGGGLKLSGSMMNPRGSLNRLLNEGYTWPQSRGFQETLKLGGRQVIVGRENE